MKGLRCPYCRSSDITDYDVVDRALCRNCSRSFSIVQEARSIFHQLWGMNSEYPNYDKELWNRLREILDF
jgi:hypothetical protein